MLSQNRGVITESSFGVVPFLHEIKAKIWICTQIYMIKKTRVYWNKSSIVSITGISKF